MRQVVRLAWRCLLLTTLSMVSFICLATDERLLGALDESGEIELLAQVQSIRSAIATVAGVRLLQSELKGLQSKFGVAPVAPLSVREGSPLALCYLAGDVAFIFRAGAMGGWRRITGFTTIRVGLLDRVRLDCVRSPKLAAWANRPENRLLNRWQLAKKLGISSLPENGLLATKRWMVDGKVRMLTTVVAYSGGSSLDWVDMSQFSER